MCRNYSNGLKNPNISIFILGLKFSNVILTINVVILCLLCRYSTDGTNIIAGILLLLILFLLSFLGFLVFGIPQCKLRLMPRLQNKNLVLKQIVLGDKLAGPFTDFCFLSDLPGNKVKLTMEILLSVFNTLRREAPSN